ncbi:HNH endonuclease [Pleionea mediterranea]|uniref:Uncharacterized protein DUF1524 n=1 Tax=Pleionea mediterranea TaxID=523701 RepID=A0A316GDU0_9GAMM|nr:HNH endonuclease [Pleionea mediterranea]PWK52827.1 uncharacterized protein DUF1524 [Pleionea mediterranea]
MKNWTLICLLVISFTAAPHSGRTDSSGGHRCSNKSISKGLCTGYHYHSRNHKKSISSSSKPISKNSKVVGPFSTLYDRKEWPHWIDTNNDCQNTRAELLIEHSLIEVKFRNNKRCSVISGRWYDHYSGKTWNKAGDVDIDHIVPLKWAHGHGGQHWSKQLKRTFANDHHNLLIVEDGLNQEKGAKGPDLWMPPNHPFRCDYVKKFDFIVKKYELNYAPSEKRIIDRMITRCQ